MKKNVVVKQPMVNFAKASVSTSKGASGLLTAKVTITGGGG